MEDISGGADDFPLEIEVALVRCQQVAATVGRDLFGVPERFANMVIHPDPTRRGCAAAATFSAILDVDLVVVFGFSSQARKVGQDGLAQAHAGGSRQLGDGRRTRHLVFAEDVDDPLHVFAVLAFRHRATNTVPPHSQRLARTRHFHILITAKCGHGPVHAGQPVLRGGDADSALFNLVTQMAGVIQQGLPINLSRIVNPWSILRPTPAYKHLPAITVRFDRAVMPVAKHVPQRLWPGIT
ncbi:hypothetical protein D3C73_1067470 [compost metagenome]